jgi:ribosome-associated protein
VNTTDSAVRGTWNIDQHFTGKPTDQERAIEYLRKNHPKHLKENERGERLLVAKSQTEKSQLQNKSNAVERMNELLDQALFVQEERVEEMPKKVKEKVDRQRLDRKKAESMKKKLRSDKGKWAM